MIHPHSNLELLRYLSNSEWDYSLISTILSAIHPYNLTTVQISLVSNCVQIYLPTPIDFLPHHEPQPAAEPFDAEAVIFRTAMGAPAPHQYR